MKRLLTLLIMTTGIVTHAQKKVVDLIVHNATIYTVDEKFSTTEAMAISNGKIVETGSHSYLTGKYKAAKTIDANEKFIYPGFIDAHAHLVGYANSLQTVNLVGTESWEEVLQRCKDFKNDDGKGWLTGRGWDQNDWDENHFQTTQD